MTLRAPRLRFLVLILIALLAAGCATTGTPTGPSTPTADSGSKAQQAGSEDGLPSIAEHVGDLERRDGLFGVYADVERGKLWLELPAPGDDGKVAEVLWLEGLLTGLGSNPVGLDRGQMGNARLIEIRRVGPKVVFVQPNLRFVADSDNVGERRATRQSFAESVLWGTDAVALDPDGTALVDFTSFVVRDAHGVARTLALTEQGKFQLDPARSYVDFPQVLSFPDNLEFEAVLTWVHGDVQPTGDHVQQTAPDSDVVTLVQHQSLVRLPDDGYRPRRADPRMGFWSNDHFDYAAPLDEPLARRYIGRHRLEKLDPSAATSKAKEPIVYYVDHGVPEPVRSALVDGARWWAQAFEAAGFEDAYRVEILPEDAHPLDVRYNVIQWVHRSTRGWSYGHGITDPRTGEILKGHVSLGSLRVRQDRLLFEGLLGTDKTGTGAADDPIELALARIRQLSAHEVGHTLGLTHNFAASTYADRASVMDYPAPLLGLRGEGDDAVIDTSRAYGIGVGAWDVQTIRWGYAQFAPGADEAEELDAIVHEGLDAGYLFLSDADARPAGASDPRANLWDNGDDAVTALETSLAVRALALERFGEHNVRPGTPLAHLQEVLAPLYFHHRYQLDAAAKAIGGMEYHYALRGDGQVPTRVVDGDRQRRALEVVLSILDAETLDLPDNVLMLLAPRPFGEERNRELFGTRTSPAFDALGAAATAADMVVRLVLHPERLGRVQDLHRRDGELPSVREVLEQVEAAAFEAESQPRRRAIRRQVESVLVRALIELADLPEVDDSLRSEAALSLSRIASRAAGGDDHVGHLRTEIQRFLERPWGTDSVEASAVPEPPPGSPIGTGVAFAAPARLGSAPIFDDCSVSHR